VSSNLLAEDLKILPHLKSAPSALLLPKIESPLEAEQFLTSLENTLKDCPWTLESKIPLVSFIETATGLLNIKESFATLKNNHLISHECTVFGRYD
jgi:citrate lyase beta subunit